MFEVATFLVEPLRDIVVVRVLPREPSCQTKKCTALVVTVSVGGTSGPVSGPILARNPLFSKDRFCSSLSIESARAGRMHGSSPGGGDINKGCVRRG